MKTYAAYGFGIALAGFIWTLIEFLAGLHGEHMAAGMYANNVVYVMAFVGLWLGMKAVRESHPEQSFGYGRALAAGSAISAFWGVGSVITTLIYMTYINPDYADAIISFQTRKMEAKGMSQDQIDAGVKMMHTTVTPVFMAIFVLVGCLITGVILSLIVAAFARREVKPSLTAI